MKKRVLIAVGEKNYTDILKKLFESNDNDFLLSNQEVFSRRFLAEIVDVEKPDILIVHDTYLGSDYMEATDRDKEMLEIIRHFRVNYDDALRIIYLCERPRGDRHLSTLVSMGVKDIFNNRTFGIDEFIEQLKDIPRFSRVEKFLSFSTMEEPAAKPSESVDMAKLLELDTGEEEDVYEEAQSPEKTKSERPTKVIEKTVVQKVVNKNVIKRDYQIQILNQTEKIVGVPVRNKIVMIGSPVSRSGSTFVSHLLARTLAKMNISTTYVENPFAIPYTYDRFDGHHIQPNYRSKFYQFSKFIDPKLESVFDWQKDDVTLICKHPTKEPRYEKEDITFDNLIKILYASHSAVTIFDVGTDWNYELFQDVLDLTDHVYVVIEPDISVIQYIEESDEPEIEVLRNLLEQEKTTIIGNRFDEHLLANTLIQDLYGPKIKTTIPSFSSLDVFTAQYEGQFLNDGKDYQKKIDSFINPILRDVLPSDFLKKQKKGTGVLSGIFGKKISIAKTEVKGEI